MRMTETTDMSSIICGNLPPYDRPVRLLAAMHLQSFGIRLTSCTESSHAAVKSNIQNRSPARHPCAQHCDQRDTTDVAECCPVKTEQEKGRPAKRIFVMAHSGLTLASATRPNPIECRGAAPIPRSPDYSSTPELKFQKRLVNCLLNPVRLCRAPFRCSSCHQQGHKFGSPK